MRARIEAVQPKGMTPIAESVRREAAAPRSTERKATVILVSDGGETCGADPCALGAELEAGRVDFTTHVIGFDLDARSRACEQLACLARAAGGLFIDAADAAQLDTALRRATDAAIEPATTACGRFVGGEPYVEGLQTWPTGGTARDIDGAIGGRSTASNWRPTQTRGSVRRCARRTRPVRPGGWSRSAATSAPCRSASDGMLPSPWRRRGRATRARRASRPAMR